MPAIEDRYDLTGLDSVAFLDAQVAYQRGTTHEIRSRHDDDAVFRLDPSATTDARGLLIRGRGCLNSFRSVRTPRQHDCRRADNRDNQESEKPQPAFGHAVPI